MTEELLKKHYDIQQTALNEIAEMIALYDIWEWTPEELIIAIDDVAGYARQADVTNPHNRPGDLDFIESHNPNYDILCQSRKK